MVFSSVAFLFYFLPAVLVLYFLAPGRAKNLVLLLCSLFFYAWGEPVYLLLMIASIFANYLLGLAISHAAASLPPRKHPLWARLRPSARAWLIFACVFNLALLGFFKYADFAAANLSLAAGIDLPQPGLPLPLGISFYTFQAMSYLIDLYRGDTPVQRNLIDFGTYVALFPQLIAGPIVRFKTIAHELSCRRESLSLFSAGALRFTAGLGKKVILANGIGAVFDSVVQTAEQAGGFSGLSVLTAWIGVFAFTMQIYFDFSGYSDMAIGLGSMFGFHFPENFDYPYLSKSITEFWRRWHMTLGTWFREYVYIPLGGNRRGKLCQLKNIAVVWALTGIWHGASWNFLVWGLFFGALLIAEKLFWGEWLKKAPALLQHAYTMLLVMISWVIFSLDTPGDIFGCLGAMFGLTGNPAADRTGCYLLSSNAAFFLLAVIAITPLPKRLWQRFLQQFNGHPVIKSSLVSVGMTLLLLLTTAFLVASSYNPFLYFRF